MQYPAIQDYWESIACPFGRFRSLSEVTVERDSRGDIFFLAGSRSVLFRVEIAGKRYAMKCYTQPDSAREERYERIIAWLQGVSAGYFVETIFKPEELYVYNGKGEGAYYPLLLTEWVEGVSLEGWIRERCARRDREALERMAERFDRFGAWFLEQESAHGDLKPDNLLVTKEDALKVIDYDGFFVPSMQGWKSPELGTKGFQHPARNPKGFDCHMDDYSIALISAGLHALAEFPEKYQYAEEENLLFDPEELVAGSSRSLNRLKEHWLAEGETELYRLGTLLGSKSPRLPALQETLQVVMRREKRRSDLGKERVPVRSNGSYGFQDERRQWVIDPVYDDVRPFREGLAAVRIGKGWFYIDAAGRKRIEAKEYDRAESFHEGVAAVKQGKRWGFIDRKGLLVIPLQFAEVGAFSEGRAAVRTGQGYGYIDLRGEWAIPPVFRLAFDFREEVAVVETESGYGYIDLSGRFLTEAQFTFAAGFRQGAATAEYEGKEIRLVKTDGGIVCEEAQRLPFSIRKK